MKINSMFQSFNAIKDSFITSSANQISSLAKFFAGEEQASTLITSTGDVLSINTQSDITTLQHRKYVGTDHEIVESLAINTSDVINNNFDYSTIKFPTSQDPLSSVILDVNDGCAFNQTIGDITAGFLSSNEISISDLSAIIDKNSGLSVQDAATLKEMLFSNSVNGKVSNWAWLTLLRQFTDGCHNAVSDETTLMDTSQPYIIQSFLSTIMPEIFNTLAAMFIVLGGIVTKVLGFILAVGAWLLNAIGSAVTDLNLNVKSSTYYLNGPVCYRTSSGYSGIPSSRWSSPGCILLKRLGNIDLYYWHTDSTDPNSTVNKNGFLNVNLDLDLVFDKLGQLFTFSNPTPTSVTVAARQTSQQMNVMRDILYSDEYAMSADKISSIICDKEKLAKYYACSILIHLAMGLSYDGRMSTPPSYEASIYPDEPIPSLPTTASLFVENSVATVMRIAYKSFLNPSYHFDWTSFSTNNAISYILRYYSDFLNVMNGSDSILTNYRDVAYVSGLQWYTGSSIVASVYALGGSTDNTYIDESNFIPTDRLATLPNISSDTLITGMITAAILATGIAVTTTVVKRKLQAKRILKQTSAVNQVNTARSAYLADPTLINQQAYIKSVRNYNLKGRFFGWGSYDYANAWVNPSASVESSISPDVYKSTLVDNDIKDEINSVKILITGNN